MIDLKKLKRLTIDLSVLYVEDDLSIQDKMKEYLNKFFKNVKVASNGVEGLEAFKKKDFDIVITDLSMPKMNGIDMIKYIKELKEGQAILITTAHSESGYLMDAIKAHVDGYILKPFDFNELNLELYKISEKIKKYRENKDYKEHLQEMLKIQTEGINDNYNKTILSMVELIERRDTYTAGHSKRVAHYCELIAKEMGYNEDECKLLHQAGILHDIGKIETPDAVLLNPKTLSDLEYKLIQEHVSVGYKILDSIPMFKPMAEIVYAHHEHYDGSGYPRGLKANSINKFSRIMIVADAFDAMTTNRIYKARKTRQEALTELSSLSTIQFHPEVVDSALVVLKDVELDKNINQLPKTKLEKERFAYFYNDNLTTVYNQDYLEVVLLKNSSELTFTNMVIFSISSFSAFNKEHGWERGNLILKEFAHILTIHFHEERIFRVFGDDFVVLGKKVFETSDVEKLLTGLMIEHNLKYRVNTLDLKTQNIKCLRDIEAIY